MGKIICMEMLSFFSDTFIMGWENGFFDINRYINTPIMKIINLLLLALCLTVCSAVD